MRQKVYKTLVCPVRKITVIFPQGPHTTIRDSPPLKLLHNRLNKLLLRITLSAFYRLGRLSCTVDICSIGVILYTMWPIMVYGGLL